MKIHEVVKKHSASDHEPTHFYHPWMRKVYPIDSKPHLEKALSEYADWRSGRLPNWLPARGIRKNRNPFGNIYEFLPQTSPARGNRAKDS